MEDYFRNMQNLKAQGSNNFFLSTSDNAQQVQNNINRNSN